MKFPNKLVLLFFVLALGFPQPAGAQLTGAGPVDPATRFPLWFQDRGGVQLTLCDVVTEIEEGPPCPGLELIDPAGGFVAGNIEEAIYYGATASIDGPGRLQLIMAVEATSGGIEGSELVLNGVLWRLRDVPPGNYTIRHPFGSEGPFQPDATGQVRGEREFVGAPPEFAGTLLGPVDWFLPNGTGFTDPVTGAVYFGDGVTLNPIEAPLGFQVAPGGFLGFRVESDNPAFGEVETNLFTVEGKVSGFGPPAAVPITVQRSHFGRSGRTAGTVALFVNSNPGAIVTAVGVGTPLPNEPITLTDPSGIGTFSAVVPLNLTTGQFPTQVQISSTTAGLTDNTITSNLTDVVTITAAQYTFRTGRLQIRAVSSDQRQPAAGRPTLTAFDQNGVLLGTFNRAGLNLTTTNVPGQVTVRSSAGGEATVFTTFR